jgi:hypothetical protein
VPNWLVIAIPLAQAAIGNSSAHKPNTTAIRLIVSSTEFKRPFPTALLGAVAGITKFGLLMSHTVIEQSARDSRSEQSREDRRTTV